jgi:hypothetical protein
VSVTTAGLSRSLLLRRDDRIGLDAVDDALGGGRPLGRLVAGVLLRDLNEAFDGGLAGDDLDDAAADLQRRSRLRLRVF